LQKPLLQDQTHPASLRYSQAAYHRSASCVNLPQTTVLLPRDAVSRSRRWSQRAACWFPGSRTVRQHPTPVPDSLHCLTRESWPVSWTSPTAQPHLQAVLLRDLSSSALLPPAC